MDNEKKGVSIFSAFLREFSTVFTLMIISFSLVGTIISNMYPEAKNISAVFEKESAVSYSVIFQAAAFSLIMALVIRVLFSGNYFNKFSIKLRYFLFYLATLINASIFSVVFKWIPADSFVAWTCFFLIFTIFFFIAIGLSFILLKFEDKKYNKLLENYKKQM